MLELRELHKHYRSATEVIRAVDGVSLTVDRGEFLALYGPSGSGKTTLLLLVGAIMRPDRGQIFYEGRDITRQSEREATLYRRRDVGFVFQTFHLQPGLSAIGNAAVKLVADGVPPRQARRRTMPLLERLGLGERIDHPPARLSGGERQRVAIARALANDPRIVLADEPTGNLDSRRGRQVLGLLSEIAHERRIAVVLVTHDPEAADIADRALVLHDGRLSERTPGPLRAEPAADAEVP